MQMLTSDQVANRLQVTRSNVNYLCRKGKLVGARKVKPSSPRSDWLIPESSVEFYRATMVRPGRRAKGHEL